MTYQNILFEVQQGIARLTLNRPDKLNSFTAAMHGELRATLEQVKADPSVRVLTCANTLALQLDLERDLIRELGATHDYHEGVAAFIERRPPQFSGD